MRFLRQGVTGSAAIAFLALGACSGAGAGNIGEILGSVLGGGAGGGQAGQGQAAGTIAGVNTQSQQIGLTMRDGQTVGLFFDRNTKVVYQNRLYPVTALERGDEVVVRVRSTQDGGYYTDSVYVTRSVSSGGSSSGGSASVQALQGTVRQIDRTNGLFALETGNGVILTVSLPYNVSSADANRFRNLRIGEHVRLHGVYINNSRVELRQFY